VTVLAPLQDKCAGTHPFTEKKNVPVRIPIQIKCRYEFLYRKKYAGTRLQKKVDSTSPLTKKAPVRIPLQKVPVRIPLQKVPVQIPLQKEVPVQIPLQKICRYSFKEKS